MDELHMMPCTTWCHVQHDAMYNMMPCTTWCHVQVFRWMYSAPFLFHCIVRIHSALKFNSAYNVVSHRQDHSPCSSAVETCGFLETLVDFSRLCSNMPSSSRIFLWGIWSVETDTVPPRLGLGKSQPSSRLVRSIGIRRDVLERNARSPTTWPRMTRRLFCMKTCSAILNFIKN